MNSFKGATASRYLRKWEEKTSAAVRVHEPNKT